MKQKIFVIVLLLLTANNGFGQCSDAGVCSLHSNDIGIFRRSGIGVDYLNGYSGDEDNIHYESVKVGGYYWPTRDFNVAVVVPVNRQRGNLGTVQGLGDIMVMADYLVNDHPGNITVSGESTLLTGPFEATSVQLGIKLPTGAVNQSGLPLLYQNGLGSTDILLGAMYSYAFPRKYDYDLFMGGITLQMPFGIAGNVHDSLERGIDLLGRIGYRYPVLHKFGIKGELLLIQRLSRSTLHNSVVYTTESSPDPLYVHSYKIDDNSLQVNVSLSASYHMKQDIFFETGFTVALLKKDFNYDGLKRSYTLFASANYHF